MNFTPNGEMFPVTPPRTPECALPGPTQPLLERNCVPKVECECVRFLEFEKLPEFVRKRGVPTECQAVDTVDNHVRCTGTIHSHRVICSWCSYSAVLRLSPHS